MGRRYTGYDDDEFDPGFTPDDRILPQYDEVRTAVISHVEAQKRSLLPTRRQYRAENRETRRGGRQTRGRERGCVEGVDSRGSVIGVICAAGSFVAAAELGFVETRRLGLLFHRGNGAIQEETQASATRSPTAAGKTRTGGKCRATESGKFGAKSGKIGRKSGQFP